MKTYLLTNSFGALADISAAERDADLAQRRHPRAAKALLALTLLALPAFGAITPGNHISCRGNATSGCTTAAIATTGTSLLVAYTSGAFGAATLTDSKSNTWIPLTVQTNNSRGQMFYVANPTTDANQTFTLSTPFGVIFIQAFFGVSTIPLNSQVGSNGGGNFGLTSIQAGTVSPSLANELVVSGVMVEEQTNSISIDSGFTASDILLGVTGVATGGGLAYKISSAAVNPTWSWTGGTGVRAAATNALLFAAPATGFPNGYSYCRVVTTSASMVSGPSDLTNYPLTVILTDADLKSTSNGGLVRSSMGYDIGFYPDCSGAGTPLKWEVESYNPISGAIVAHVLRPALSHATNDTVGLYYGGDFINSESTGSAAWDASYLGVWHLSDGTSLASTDSTSNAHNGTATNAVAAAGKVDGAAAFAGNGKIVVGVGLNPAGAGRTYEAWVNASSFANAYNSVVSLSEDTSTVFTILVKGNGKLALYLMTGTGAVIAYDGAGSHTLTAGTWYHLTMTYSSAAGLVGYVNGVVDGASAANGPVGAGGANTTDIGDHPSIPGRNWNGFIDEVRISNIARSANWIATQYRNQSAPATYISTGPRIAAGGRVRHKVSSGL